MNSRDLYIKLMYRSAIEQAKALLLAVIILAGLSQVDLKSQMPNA